jgi:hypothetical protein
MSIYALMPRYDRRPRRRAGSAALGVFFNAGVLSCRALMQASLS